MEGGIISEYRILQGNPPDEQLWVASSKHHQKLFGHLPDLATADRGVYSAENERVARVMGVKQVALPQPCAKTQRRQHYETQKWFRAAFVSAIVSRSLNAGTITVKGMVIYKLTQLKRNALPKRYP